MLGFVYVWPFVYIDEIFLVAPRGLEHPQMWKIVSLCNGRRFWTMRLKIDASGCALFLV
jgi:hypothetical protein